MWKIFCVMSSVWIGKNAETGVADMEIEIYSDDHIEEREALADYFRTAVARELRPVAGHITGVELHLNEDRGKKRAGDDKRCTMVIQLDGHLPMSVTHHGTTLGTAVEGACDRLTRMIENSLGLLREPRNRSDAYVREPNLT
jgi:ribosome-associated translation inhibitor RaiA